MSKWYVKQVTPDSVIATYDNLDEAEEYAHTLNTNYQTDNYIVEPYDVHKKSKFLAIKDYINNIKEKTK